MSPLAFVRQEMLEAVILSELTCAKMMENLILIIDQLQELSASPIAPKGSEVAAEPLTSTVSLHTPPL